MGYSRGSGLLDQSRHFATLLDYAAHCESLEEFRRLVLLDLRQWAGGDGALFRPGPSWAGSHALYVDEGTRFTDLYVTNAERFRHELTRWCELSRGTHAFIDTEVYGARERDRMATYAEIMSPERIRGILACPLAVSRGQTGLVFLFRRGPTASRFSSVAAAAATRLLPAISIAEHLLAAAFARGRKVRAPSSSRPPVDAFDQLPPRQQQIAALLAHGLQGKEIAELLDLSPHTVHVHTKRVYDKLGLHGRTHVALLASQLGIVRGAPHSEAHAVLAAFTDLLRRELTRRFVDLEPVDDRAAVAESVVSTHRWSALAPRERQIASLIARGLSSRQIASLVGTSFHTVRAQTQRVFAKMGIRGRTRFALEFQAAHRV